MAKEILITNDGIFVDGAKFEPVITYTIKENGKLKTLTLEIPIENTLLVHREAVSTETKQK